jgi:DNA helicase-2/ATP-dependent DNA helicase PcrA
VKIARLIGGAGTGKTTELLRVMDGALSKLGNDPTRLGFASFTRAARAEAVDRASAAWGCSPELLAGPGGWFRTIHSTCYRCVGVAAGQLLRPEVKESIEWISKAIDRPVVAQIDEDTGHVRYRGDEAGAAALNCWNLARATLRSLADVAKEVLLDDIDGRLPALSDIVRIAERYETAKRLDGRLDYTDLLSRFAGVSFSADSGASRITPVGDTPEVSAWLFDEQQDTSPLLDAVCKRLVSAPSVQWCYVVGDPFQSIYSFAGSSADCFLGWPAEKERTMPKSYRCPAPILSLGERCLIPIRGYFDRGIEPADHDGVVEDADDIAAAIDMIDPNDSWLLIARTNYQAGRLFAAMCDARKPVRWVKSPEGGSVKGDGLKALRILQHGGGIDGGQWSRCLNLLPTRAGRGGPRCLEHGTKKRFSDGAEQDRWDAIFLEDLTEVGGTTDLQEKIRSGDWVSLVDHGEEWGTKADRWGVELACEPKVKVGTIHSVKGAEADNVLLLTTTSSRVTPGDEESRLAYVGVTRARRRLVVLNERGWKTPRLPIP